MQHTFEQDNLLFLSKAFDFLEENASRFIKDTPKNQSFIAHPNASIEHKPEESHFNIT